MSVDDLLLSLSGVCSCLYNIVVGRVKNHIVLVDTLSFDKFKSQNALIKWPLVKKLSLREPYSAYHRKAVNRSYMDMLLNIEVKKLTQLNRLRVNFSSCDRFDFLRLCFIVHSNRGLKHLEITSSGDLSLEAFVAPHENVQCLELISYDLEGDAAIEMGDQIFADVAAKFPKLSSFLMTELIVAENFWS
jgi:hypothetical protein